MVRRWLAAAAVTVLAAAVPATVDAGPVQRLRVEVLATYPHDPTAFTQGLEWHDGRLYESTGRYGFSDLRVSEIETGRVRQRVPLPEEVFGEGMTVVGDRIWQLTWREQVAFQRDRGTLAETGRATYEGEGWGLCYDERSGRLVMSDGTPRLTFRDPQTFAPLASVTVRLGADPVEMINELECVDGDVWANLWQTDRIVRIDPVTGQVEAVVDASGLLSADQRAQADVLNGIAAVPGTDTFLVTGKLWPTMFLVRFVPAD
ncbi:MAG TPA: glutaminyl-peptide cyclotransferase [Natronosporangium sp.]|nr:glutaminyl-peptide cyclotransferase [Natronosporangium sp.]